MVIISRGVEVGWRLAQVLVYVGSRSPLVTYFLPLLMF